MVNQGDTFTQWWPVYHSNVGRFLVLVVADVPSAKAVSMLRGGLGC